MLRILTPDTYPRGRQYKEEMDKATKSLLKKYKELQYNSETKKVKCTLSGHEMPCRLEVLQSYVGGKKFTTLKSHKDFNFQKLEPLIVTSTRRKYQLFCALTNRYVNRKPDEVKSHISGKKYKSALEKYNAGKLELFKERIRKAKPSKEESKHESDLPKLTNDDREEQQQPGSVDDGGGDSDEIESGQEEEDDGGELDSEEKNGGYWVPQESGSESGEEGDEDAEMAGLDPEFRPGGGEEFEGGEGESVEASTEGDGEDKPVKRVSRRRKAKLALLQSMKRTRVSQKSKTSFKAKSRKSKKTLTTV